jgi:hypothetical protein
MPDPNTLAKKLLLKPGYRILLINAPAGYLDSLSPLPDGVQIAGDPAGSLDFVQLFARNKAELDRLLPDALRAIRPDGLLWLCYTKLSAHTGSDITRDRGWETARAAGLEPVTQVSIDDTWSALRFRPLNR